MTNKYTNLDKVELSRSFPDIVAMRDSGSDGKNLPRDTAKGIQSYTQTLDLCMLHDRLPSTNEQICGRRIMAITRASQYKSQLL